MLQNLLIGIGCIAAVWVALKWIQEASDSSDPYAIFVALWGLPFLFAFFGWIIQPHLYWVAAFTSAIAILSTPFAMYRWLKLIPERREAGLAKELHDLIQQQVALERNPESGPVDLMMAKVLEAKAVKIQTKLDQIRRAQAGKEAAKRDQERRARETREAEYQAKREAEDAIRERIANKARGPQ